MKHLNIVRLILAGLVSAVIIFVFEGVANGVVLSDDWKVWAAFAGKVFIMPSVGYSMTLWAVQALAAGLSGAFIYAGIHKWVGAKMRAAYVSALLIWAPGWLGLTLDKMAMGVETLKLLDFNLLAALLGCLVGQFAASFIYRDKGE